MTERAPPAPDQAARDRALDRAVSFIVQAPAGSGKTTLLTQRYLTLLAGVERPEAVIAITFTKKAAAEMRERVLQALTRSAAAVPARDAADARTLECAAGALAHAARCGWSLLEQPARLRIQTIDSLSHWLAARLPILSRAGASLQIEQNALPLYRLAAERTLAELEQPGALGDALALVLAHLGNEAERLCALIAQMLAGRDRWLRIVLEASGAEQEAALRAALEDSLASLAGSALARARARLPEQLGVALLPLLRGAAQRLVARRAEFAALADAPPWPLPVSAAAAPLWLPLAELLLTRQGEWRRALDVRQGLPPTAAADRQALLALIGSCAAVPGLREALAAVAQLPPSRYPQREWQVLAALTRVLLAGAAQLAAVFAERGVVDFTAVSHAALQALGTPAEPTDLTIALDGRIEHLLVDEFQDTSSAQVALLERLTAGWSLGDGRTLFLVGDPMQSIYGFRQANVGLFLSIRSAGLGEVRLEPLTLTANFRSRPQLVEWFNDAFVSVLPDRDEQSVAAVSYSPSVPTRAPLAGAGVELSVLADAAPALEAARVLQIIRAERRANPAASIAVLGRSRAQLAAIAGALGGAGIGYQGVELVPLAERPAVRDLVSLTRALLHPADRIAWLACLRAPWCGLDLVSLEALAGDGAARVLRDALQDPARLARLVPEARARLARTSAVLESALAERGRRGLGAWVEAAWLALGGPATLEAAADLANAAAFFAHLDTLARAADLDDPPALEASLDSLYAAPDPAAPATLQLLTIHRAKGLEWDVVILPGLGRTIRGAPRQLLEWLEFARDDGAQGLVLAPHLARASDSEPLESWLRAVAARRSSLELGRLVYVATTRAKERLHLVCHLPHAPDNAPGVPRRGSLLATLWPAVAAQVTALAAAAAAPATAQAEAASQAPALRRLVADWSAPPPQAALVPVADPARQQRPSEFEYEWVTSAARHVGTVVHEELERIARQGLAPAAALAGRERLWARRLTELGVGREQLQLALERVGRALGATAADPRGAWLLDPTHAAAASELDLSCVRGGRTERARIDRTFVAAGVRWIVDFKTSLHEGTSLDAFLDREWVRYRGQLEQYAALVADFDPGRPIRLGLYFPLHAAWREWARGEPAPG